jgi:hypothetical protein
MTPSEKILAKLNLKEPDANEVANEQHNRKIQDVPFSKNQL